MSQFDEKVSAFIERHVAEVEPLASQAAIAQWDFECKGTKESEERASLLSANIAKIFTRTNEYAELSSIPNDKIADPLLKRQHKLLLNSYRGSQIPPSMVEEIVTRSMAINSQFNNYRAQIDGKTYSDNELSDLLRNSNKSDECEKAWNASKQIGAKTADQILELAEIKNREAKKLGFDNVYTMELELQETPQDWLFKLLNDLKVKSDPIFTEFKEGLDSTLAERFSIKPNDLMPWHYGEKFFQAPPRGEVDLDPLFKDKDVEKITNKFYQNIGMPIEDIVANSDLYEREGKCQHAFCMDADRKGDVRVLCNLKSNERWMNTNLHEYGHAVYDYYTDFNLPYLLRGPSHILTTEAVALFMGGLVHNAAWLSEYIGLDPKEAGNIAKIAMEQDRAQKLIFMRWVFVVCNFEREMYSNPKQDLNKLWWDLVEEYQFLKRPEDRNNPDWAAKIHIALYPAYYHNYLIGEIFASQMRYALQRDVTEGDDKMLVTNPATGAFFKEKLFYPANRHDWQETIKFCAGEPLNIDYFLKEIK